MAEQPEGNFVLIGKKGIMGYVLAVVTQFNSGAEKVIIKARGKLISRAVDVAEIVKNRFMPNAKVANVKIATEEVTGQDGKTSRVSSIEIEMQKG